MKPLGHADAADSHTIPGVATLSCLRPDKYDVILLHLSQGRGLCVLYRETSCSGMALASSSQLLWEFVKTLLVSFVITSPRQREREGEDTNQ